MTNTVESRFKVSVEKGYYYVFANIEGKEEPVLQEYEVYTLWTKGGEKIFSETVYNNGEVSRNFKFSFPHYFDFRAGKFKRVPFEKFQECKEFLDKWFLAKDEEIYKEWEGVENSVYSVREKHRQLQENLECWEEEVKQLNSAYFEGYVS